MDDDGAVAQFTAITDATPERAQQYLRLADGNIEQAIELFFANDGADVGGGTASAPVAQAPQPQPAPGSGTRPTRRRQTYEDDDGIVHLDSDNEDDLDQDIGIDEQTSTNPRIINQAPLVRGSSAARPAGGVTTRSQPNGTAVEDDEAIARRLQEEIYGAGASATGATSTSTDLFDEHGVRAPLARTTETLVGPGSYGPVGHEDDTHAAVLEQLRVREAARRARAHDRPGPFNQTDPDSLESMWHAASGEQSGTSSHRTPLPRGTIGASQTSSKAQSLAEMFRPPFDLMSRLRWEDAREHGKESEKWLLVDIQHANDFHCQALNRDIWKNPGVKETVKENFIFVQYGKDDPRGAQYIQYYFPDHENMAAYPHIAIVDPRTGEQVKKWSGLPTPSAADFLMQLHEFLDRYSLKSSAKNPVAKRKAEPKKETQIDKMTEEQQMEMAMQNSLVGGGSNGTEKQGLVKHEDPDDLTRGDTLPSPPPDPNDVNMAEPIPRAPTNAESDSPFAAITSANLHIEPPSDVPSTRIQFRHPNGRPIVRRFALADRVRRIFEWLKAEPIAGKQGLEFGLVSMGKNLIGMLDETIEGAGLKNSAVMVEFVEE